MHLKVFLKLKKTLKTLSSGPIYKKTQKTKKTTKKPKKNHWAGLKKKNGFFFNPARNMYFHELVFL